ncbi:PQ-loop domain-containing transporter [Ureaplasma zalophigenitalium]|uniref:PQ-loop domain-containing transporter n=1 Tax=Ureaplasma zalophigenitalium TaxID=907723 RepID=A0ABT3BPZ4_9BACT|nr:PQ-loop domain-containing transporter [Ureaplasma zalophigenitalium]MCV3754325.1 PQ-loop domain-containing transporter [Ureaplasma zalophigenitalium]
MLSFLQQAAESGTKVTAPLTEADAIKAGFIVNQDVFFSNMGEAEQTYGFPMHPWAVFFQVIGAVLVFIAYVPGVVATLKSKRTEALSLGMWVLSVLGLAFLTIFAWMGVSVSVGGFILVAISETLSMFLTIIVLSVKISTMQKAKKAGMSELEYCNLHYPINAKINK